MSIGIAMMLFAGFTMLLRGGPIERIVMPALMAVLAAGMVWMLAGTRYVLDGNTLAVFCGPLRWRVDVSTITRAFPTDDPTSGPALSLDGVQIDHVKNGKPDTLLVSPADREGFIAALKAANPGIA